jgi:Replication-relaxation
MRERGIILTEGVVLGLFFVQRYRFLTIDQFARASGMHRDTARQLRSLELRGVLSHFGNACLPGHGRTPKVYFLTRKGWELLSRESDIPAELLGSHREVKVDSRWSPQMYHRLRTVDLMISAEVAVRSRSRLSMVATFLEYRRVKRGTRVERETTDYVAKEETSDTRIIPDAAFIVENPKATSVRCSLWKWAWEQSGSSPRLPGISAYPCSIRFLSTTDTYKACAIGKPTPALGTFASSHSFLSPSASKG